MPQLSANLGYNGISPPLTSFDPLGSSPGGFSLHNPGKGDSEMKRLAKPGEGEIPIGASEIPGPMAYTDPETGERMIDAPDEPEELPVKAPKPTAKRNRAAKD
jgi:hypothetical protein